MNRRTTIKSIFALGVAGISSFSVYKWISVNKIIDRNEILKYKTLIAELAETIIPQTDTPGAKAANVDQFIINVLINCNDKRTFNKFFEGLIELENYVISHYDKSFVNCTPQQKYSVVEHFEERDTYSYAILNKISNKLLGQSFFLKLKSLTVEGYCSSEVGAKQGLAYDYIPGNFKACIPLTANQKSWATK